MEVNEILVHTQMSFRQLPFNSIEDQLELSDQVTIIASVEELSTLLKINEKARHPLRPSLRKSYFNSIEDQPIWSCRQSKPINCLSTLLKINYIVICYSLLLMRKPFNSIEDQQRKLFSHIVTAVEHSFNSIEDQRSLNHVLDRDGFKELSTLLKIN